MVHIWHIFYVLRAQFVRLMVDSLARIVLSSNVHPESRRFALDFADQFIFWDKCCMLDEMSHGPGADGFSGG